MKYQKTYGPTDKEKSIFRVLGICFEDDANEEKIEEIIKEAFPIMDTTNATLMTAKALCNLIGSKSDEFMEQMLSMMPINTKIFCFNFEITRFTDNTFFFKKFQ